MVPRIKVRQKKDSKEVNNTVRYDFKGVQNMPDEIKKMLVDMNSVVRIELISYLTKVNAYLITKQGSERELKAECQKFLHLLKFNKKGASGGITNRDLSRKNPHTRRMDGLKRR